MERKSLILVTVDCLRADHCGFHGYSRPTTPFLDELAEQAFLVPTALVAGAPTYYSFPALLASRMPLALGRDIVGLAPGETTLASALHEAGYSTAAFSAANPYISPHFGYDQGFDFFEDFLHTSPLPAAAEASPVSTSYRSKVNQSLRTIARVMGLRGFYDDLYFQYCVRVAARPAGSIDALRKFPSAETMVDHALTWIHSAPRPFFLWLHLMDPHAPYYPPAESFRALTGRELSPMEACYLNEYWNRSDLSPPRLCLKKNAVMDLYDAGIRSVDSQIARFTGQLKELQVWDECMFVLTADHGEEFLEHGRRFHAPVSLHDEIARIPLMIRVPGREKKAVAKTPFSHLHLAPTLLDILNLPTPESFRGRSLWRHLQEGTRWDDPAVSECAFACTNPFRAESRLAPRLVSVRDYRRKLVLRLGPEAIEELYDVSSEAGENNLLPESAEREVRARFLKLARTHLSQSSQIDRMMWLNARLRDIQVELAHRDSGTR